MKEKIEIPQTTYHKVLNFVSIFLLLGTVLFLIVVWDSLPYQLPKHYNFFGEIDGWGNKSSILFLPIIAWLMYLGLSLIEKFPNIWNTGVTVTEENKDTVYLALKDMLITIKAFIVLLFCYLTYVGTKPIPLSKWFLPVTLLLVFWPIIHFFVKVKRH